MSGFHRPKLTKRKTEVDRWMDTKALIERLIDEAKDG